MLSFVTCTMKALHNALADLVSITTVMDPTDWAALQHLLTSNIAPLPHEHAIAQRVINELNTELTALDQRTLSLQQELKQLVARRLVIKDRRRRCAGVISARRRLPPEVTRVIMDALWKGALYQDYVVPSQSPIPRLMLVSREWHNIALATPHFWASLYLNPRSRIETTVKGAGTWLSRAKSHPLSLGLLITEADSYHTCFVQFLEQWAQHIAVLEFNAFRSSLDVAMPNLPLQNIIWPELHTLLIGSPWRALTGDGMEHQPIDNKSPTRFPALRNVDIQTAVSAPIFSMMGIPWGNLVSLNVDIDYDADNDSSNRYLAMLRECSGRLQELSMTVCRHMPLPLQGWTQPIILPHLTRLRITPSIDLMGEEWIVDYLRFPAVQSITYHLPYTAFVSDGVINTTRNPIDAITSLVRSSRATKSVQYFELLDQRLELSSEGPAVRMGELFKYLQNLEHLRISTYRCDFEGLGDIPKSVRGFYVAIWDFGKESESDWLDLEERMRTLSRTRRDLGCPLEVALIINEQPKEIA